jgi:hypothetical protein
MTLSDRKGATRQSIWKVMEAKFPTVEYKIFIVRLSKMAKEGSQLHSDPKNKQRFRLNSSTLTKIKKARKEAEKAGLSEHSVMSIHESVAFLYQLDKKKLRLVKIKNAEMAKVSKAKARLRAKKSKARALAKAKKQRKPTKPKRGSSAKVAKGSKSKSKKVKSKTRGSSSATLKKKASKKKLNSKKVSRSKQAN